MLKELIYKKAYNKKVLILGFGKEGQSTLKLLRRILPDQFFTIADKDINLEKSSAIINEDDNIKLILGEKYLDYTNDFDLIIKSPGISLDNANKDVNISNLTSQTDLFINAFSGQIIGITGTKGKSTTASLVFHLLQQTTDNIVLSGNIGIPPFEVESNINNSTIIILELSSHQLEYISASPKTAVILNIYPEHLDHYSSFREYQKAKLNITKFQRSDDHLIIPEDDLLIKKLLDNNSIERDTFEYSVHTKVKKGCYLESKSIIFSNNDDKVSVFSIDRELPLAGEHNLMNVMAAINICMVYDLPLKLISQGIHTFKPLEHRMEFAGEFNGIKYYNDSISTIPESTIHALQSIKDVNTLILGGFDRGIDYDNLISFIIRSKLENIILTGKVGQRIYEGLIKDSGTHQNLYFTERFAEVIEIAGKVTRKGHSCLFSPAAASYDKFKNFEERGRLFKKHISET